MGWQQRVSPPAREVRNAKQGTCRQLCAHQNDTNERRHDRQGPEGTTCPGPFRHRRGCDSAGRMGNGIGAARESEPPFQQREGSGRECHGFFSPGNVRGSG